MLSRKVILTGSFGVGKTSLFRRFINETFNDKYITTIGVKVDKRALTVDGREIAILLWDIAGEVKQDKVPRSYFIGTSAVIYVIDLSRPSTFKNMKTDMEILKGLVPEAIIKIVGNKKDLFSNEELENITSQFEIPADILTSAKTGENVAELFEDLARAFLA